MPDPLTAQYAATHKTLEGQDLRHQNLDGRHFAGFNFTGADLTGANFSECAAQNAIFDHAILDQACLAQTDFTGSRFFHTRFLGGDMTGAIFDRCAFSGPDFWAADFARALSVRDCLLHWPNDASAPLCFSGAPVVLSGLPARVAKIGDCVLIGDHLRTPKEWLWAIATTPGPRLMQLPKPVIEKALQLFGAFDRPL